jgi:uncharacterized protein (TIGR00725 family)
MPRRRVQVAVCGPAECTPEEAGAARRVGELLAAGGAVVICGGGTGVMTAVADGAQAGGGLVIGVLPGPGGRNGVADVDVTVATDLGEARNAVIVQSADAVIVVGGSWGTMSEVALAMRRGGVPVVTLGGWQVLDGDGRPVPGPVPAVDAAHAVDLALALADADSDAHPGTGTGTGTGDLAGRRSSSGGTMESGTRRFGGREA